MDDSRLPERDRLVALNRSATAARLMAGVIHEVNNVLQVISGTVELLQSRPDVPSTMLPALDRLSKQSARAATIFAEAMVFTRGAVAETSRVNLREVAEHSLGLRAFYIKRAGLTARVAGTEGVHYLTTGNRAQIQQTVLNLLINAEQAAAGTKGEIVLELGRDGQQVSLVVSDPGPGVSPAMHTQLFEAFASDRDPWEGAGLGLWVARAVAEAHAGTLTLEPRPAGSAFALRLPAAD